MKVSVFTPMSASGNPYILEAFRSLQRQTYTNWEWVILGNGPGWSCPPEFLSDGRVRVGQANATGSVGALKREACARCTGDILLELDHDDILTEDALTEVVRSVRDGCADFVYSDFAEFKDGTWEPNPYSSEYGWHGYTERYSGHGLIAMSAPEDPVAWRRIEWAPNHLRAWRRSFYERIGGHDASLPFADDHDLVLRSYLEGGRCERIPLCLYLYRVHPKQNVQARNAEIQQHEATVYERHIYRLAEKIADERRLMKLDLCGGIDAPEHYTPIDIEVNRTDGITADLNEDWPLPDRSVGVIRAFDALEHLRDPVHTMNEAWRVLAPGGFMLVRVPSTAGPGAWCDPTHVSFWNALSFRYYSDDRFRRYLRGLRARFQVARLFTTGGDTPYVVAELIALKSGYAPMGEVRC